MQIMVAHEKHGPRYINLEAGLGPVSEALMKERAQSGEWYDEAAMMAVARAMSGNPKFTPWHFLHSRAHHEYELVEVVEVETLSLT